MWRECKRRFSSMHAGICSYCGRHIVHNMARHVSTYHLDLGQLWRCQVLWCSHWKGTHQDCIDHIRLRHHVGLSVKTANLRKWFPPWTVTRVAWSVALKPNVLGIATDVVLFSEHWVGLVHHYQVTASVSPIALSVELSWSSYWISLTGPVLRPGRCPNMVGTRVQSRVHRRVVRHRRPSGLHTARRTMTLWLGILPGLSPNDVDVFSVPTSPLPLGLARRTLARSLPARSVTPDSYSHAGQPRTCHRCNCRQIGCDWTWTWMLSICSLCLRRLRDLACI